MSRSLASTITRSASIQTWSTIRFLADRERREDAFRAYAYFRWVDDVLDAPSSSATGWTQAERTVRSQFVDRQRSLFDAARRPERPHLMDPREAMLVELVGGIGPGDEGLAAYLDGMFRVMEFDVERRGRLVSGAELADYSRWLAIAVTEAMHQFIGHGRASGDGDRYAAVTGAHIVHMLRDTEVDVAAGYYNVPGEVLRDASIGPRDIRCDAYRAWVGDRLRSARTELEAGRRYFAGVESVRLRLAGFAYIARFTEVARSLEHGGLQVGGPNDDGRSLAAGFRAGASALVWMARPHRLAPHPTPAVPAGEDRV